MFGKQYRSPLPPLLFFLKLGGDQSCCGVGVVAWSMFGFGVLGGGNGVAPPSIQPLREGGGGGAPLAHSFLEWSGECLPLTPSIHWVFGLAGVSPPRRQVRAAQVPQQVLLRLRRLQRHHVLPLPRRGHPHQRDRH